MNFPIFMPPLSTDGLLPMSDQLHLYKSESNNLYDHTGTGW